MQLKMDLKKAIIDFVLAYQLSTGRGCSTNTLISGVMGAFKEEGAAAPKSEDVYSAIIFLKGYDGMLHQDKDGDFWTFDLEELSVCVALPEDGPNAAIGVFESLEDEDMDSIMYEGGEGVEYHDVSEAFR